MWFDSVLGALAGLVVALAARGREPRKSGKFRKASLVAWVIVLGVASTGASAQTVTLDLAVSTGDMIDGYSINISNGVLNLGLRPGINDAGTLTFLAGSFNTGGTGVFTQTVKLDHYGDVFSGKTLNHPVGALGSINSSGLAVSNWYYDIQAGRGLFTQNEVLASTGDVIGGRTISYVAGSPVVNDSGIAVFYGYTNPGDGIFTQDNLVVKNGDVIGGKTLAAFGYNPSINNAGTIAFTGYSTGGGFGTALFTQSQVLVTKGDVVSGATIYSLGDPVINDGGQVVSYAQLDDGFSHRDAILKVGSGLVAKTGDVIAGKTLTGLFKNPTINDSGLVAYTGTFSGGSGIFADNLLIVQTGDTLEGKIFSAFSDPAINDLNQVAFYANFTDGSQGIVIADITTVVPEPSGFFLAAMAAVALVAVATWRTRKSRAQ